MWQYLRVTHEEFSYFSSLIPVIPSSIIHFEAVKIVFVLQSIQITTNTTESDYVQWKAVEEPIFPFFPLEEQYIMTFHNFHHLLFTRLFPIYLAKLDLQVLYKAYPDSSKLYGYLYCKPNSSQYLFLPDI